MICKEKITQELKCVTEDDILKIQENLNYIIEIINHNLKLIELLE